MKYHFFTSEKADNEVLKHPHYFLLIIPSLFFRKIKPYYLNNNGLDKQSLIILIREIYRKGRSWYLAPRSKLIYHFW